MKRNGLGYIEVIIPRKLKNRAMDLIMANGLLYKKIEFTSELDIKITISAHRKDDFSRVLNGNGIDASFSKSKGIGAIIEKYRDRWGLFIGAIVLILSVYISSLFIWRIDIEGNENVSDGEILRILEESGCALGTFIPAIDYDDVHNEFLMTSENISWISVNITGNVAKVLVKERMKENEDEGKDKYTNVISKYDAQIAMIQLYNGKKVVSIGDVVKKGDLLISGVINSQSQGVRYVHADGIVKAYVNKPIKIKIPLQDTKKSYTGNVHTEKSVNFFSKNIKFLLNHRNPYTLYDTIETSEALCLFGRIKLPLTLNVTYHKEYENISCVYTYEQAVDMAFAQLRTEMDSALKDSELISKSVKTYYDELAFYIECNLYCLDNIAEVVEIKVE